MIGFTWGHLWTGRKVIVRTDSKHGCASLNKLWSKTEPMALLCDLWEDIQFHFGFEALIVFCEGSRNKWADAVSKKAEQDVVAVLKMESENIGLMDIEYKRIEVQWKRGGLSCDVGQQLTH